MRAIPHKQQGFPPHPRPNATCAACHAKTRMALSELSPHWSEPDWIFRLSDRDTGKQGNHGKPGHIFGHFEGAPDRFNMMVEWMCSN